MKRNILVFPCGSEIGLDIYDTVKYSTYFHLIGANSVDDHGKFVYDDYISGIPYESEPGFISAMKAIVEERNIDAIYPTMDSVITKLKAFEEELGCKIIAPISETTEICLSKAKTYKRLSGVIRTPRLYEPKSICNFPCFAKPDVGYGARGTKIINNENDLKAVILEKEDILLMEYLPGEEFTVDCFTNKDRKLLYSAARKRNRIKSGISVNTSFAEDQSEFVTIAESINNSIEFRGAWFFQVKRDYKGQLCLMEIAARIGGSSMLSHAIGVNLALLTLFDAFNYPVSVKPNDYHIELDRALCCRYKTDIEYQSVYVDYDDCLVLEKSRINTDLVKFLFECINRNKKIYLLSKHDGDLQTELIHYHINDLFTEIYHIDKSADKCDYINDRNAIFIDDSNAERQKVHDRLGIYVFSPEMVNILM